MRRSATERMTFSDTPVRARTPMAANSEGRALGARSFQKSCQGEARRERRNSSAPGFTSRKPVMALTSIGKKESRAATTIFGVVPKPNRMTSPGATATIGVTLITIASGNSARSASREWAITTARAMAKAEPMSRPSVASYSVQPPSRQKNSGSSTNRSQTADGGGTTMMAMSRHWTQNSQNAKAATRARAGQLDVDGGADAAGARRQHDDSIREGDRLRDGVGDEHHGLAAGGRGLPDAQQLVAHGGAADLVQGAERFVHQQERGVKGQGAGDGDALLHAAGELVGVVGAELGEAGELQQLLRRGRRPVAGGAVDLEGEVDVGEDGAPGEEGGVLGDEADVAAALGRGGRGAVDLRLAAGGPQQAADDAEERGLAAAAGTDHRDE